MNEVRQLYVRRERQYPLRRPRPRLHLGLREPLTQAVNPGVGTTNFRYDPFGRRIQKSGPNGTTNYLYDGQWENVIEEVDNSGNILAH